MRAGCGVHILLQAYTHTRTRTHTHRHRDKRRRKKNRDVNISFYLKRSSPCIFEKPKNMSLFLLFRPPGNSMGRLPSECHHIIYIYIYNCACMFALLVSCSYTRILTTIIIQYMCVQCIQYTTYSIHILILLYLYNIKFI